MSGGVRRTFLDRLAETSTPRRIRGTELMIIRRYGTRFHSVTRDFDPAAMTEVGFRRNGEQEWGVEDFEAEYELVREEEIIADATDPVQEKAERGMLVVLEERFDAILASLEDGQLLSVESKSGVDYPRTRYERSTKGGQDFTYTLDRPLRLGVWAKKG